MFHVVMVIIGALVLAVCLIGFFRSYWQPTPRGPKAGDHSITMGDWTAPSDPGDGHHGTGINGH